AAEPARILRVPDTLNHKYDPPRMVVVEAFDDSRRYTLAELRDALPPLVVHEAREESPVEHTLSVAQRQHLAAAWLMMQEPAVQGQHGDQQTFTICAAVARGFALDDGDAAVEALSEWNRRCLPPWPEGALRR